MKEVDENDATAATEAEVPPPPVQPPIPVHSPQPLLLAARAEDTKSEAKQWKPLIDTKIISEFIIYAAAAIPSA